ncbi:MAG: TraR/DksA C4-type zinc finger protein [Spirochaetia bacterium]|nr:TraR/DksA C4-type zinc finger protein [Spirochaetia bacterium]
MNKKQVKTFEKRLQEERDKILLKLNYDKESFGDLKKNEVGDIVDKAFNMWEKDRAIDISENDKRTLQDLDRALQRLHAGQYGLCTLCGFDIDEKRLEAIPWAEKCVDPARCKNKGKKK